MMDKDYRQIVHEMITPYFERLSRLLEPNPDYSKVDYVEQYDEEWGKSDVNYTNRYRVLLAIYWSGRYKDKESEYEQLIRRLLKQEIIDRETNSFQGAGDALHTALYLLKTYGREEDEALFVQAKEANFDTYCSIDTDDINDQMLYKRDQLDLESSLYLAHDLAEYDYEYRLIELWIASQTVWDKENLTRLRYLEKNRSNLQGEIAVLRKLEALHEASDDRAYCSCADNLCQKEIEAGEHTAAWNTLQKIIPRISNDEMWHCDGLGRNMMEICSDLIIFFGKDNRISAEIWTFAQPGISASADNMGLNLYDKAITAATLMGDDDLAKRLAKHRKKLASI